jgi:hypothetical protein
VNTNPAATPNTESPTMKGRKMITPEQARANMPSARERAAKTVAAQIDSFVAAGIHHGVMLFMLEGNAADQNAMIGELIRYRQAGWDVEFVPEQSCLGAYALVSLPAVVS